MTRLYPQCKALPALLRADHHKVSELFKVEHATLKALIAQMEGIEPNSEMFDAKIIVLSEYVTHHVKEERDEMFPKAKAADLNMKELGAQMAARKLELLAKRV